MAEKRAERPLLVCPECSERYTGHARIGNRKRTCRLCNRFAQAVRREISRDLAVLHPRDAEDLRILAEDTVYRRMVTQ